jgi:hypothetical protein
LVLSFGVASQQLNENCVVAVLNRTVQVNADGSWILPNVPANFGLVRARATCVENGITTFGQSDLFVLPKNGTVNLPHIQLGNTSPIPTSILVTASPSTNLTTAGATAQLKVQATYANNTTKDITAASTGTLYNVSNSAIATVATNGLVTAVTTGTVVIQAVNEGAQGLITIHVVLAGVSHGGIPDTWAIANGLDPNDPAMPSQDPDKDGLTNLQEFQAGTDPNKADTDGDGLTDGQEVLAYKTNPLVVSSDGTGIPDGVEVQTGTLGGTLSSKLAKSLQSLEVKPATFVLTVNSIEGQANQQLAMIGHLIDGKTTVDLTSTQTGTQYSSSDLTICNFGSPDGNVFAAAPGSCTITVSNNGFTATANGTVTAPFTPKSLSFVPIPGFANGVAVNGNYAYVAAGGAGIQVVNVTDRTNPQVVASLALPGNANDVRLVGNTAFVAAGTAGLHAIDVTNPLAPVLKGTLATNGNAFDLVVQNNIAYVANGSNLFIAYVSVPGSMSPLGTLSLSGTIQGVDVDPVRKLAVVAAGGNGIDVVDISTPAAPVLRGSVSTGNAIDVAIKGNYAFVADFVNSTVSVDITTPTVPVVRSNITDPNLGGFLNDIVVNGNFALGADVKFFNGIPITDISDPTNLQARAILNFTQRDDNGMGLAADGSFVYLVTEHSNIQKFGSIGDSRLYIGQYRALQDLKGIPPTAQIVSPAAGSTVIQGASLSIIVNAADDIAVAAVNFLVNGAVVFTATAPPYQFNFTVPTGITSLTLGANAVDLGGNIGTAQTITVHVIPDPGTLVTGRVILMDSTPVAGAAVTCLNGTTVSGVGGSFSIPGVATVSGGIFCTASFVKDGQTLRGTTASFAPVAGGTTAVGDLTIRPGGQILLISDADTPSTTSLITALTAAGNVVTVRPPPEYTWDNTNPPLTGFNCMVHLNGATPYNPFPVAAQQSLLAFVQAGNGYMSLGWSGYEARYYAPLMIDLALHGNGTWSVTGDTTYSKAAGQASHPINLGLPDSFPVNGIEGHEDFIGGFFQYATNPAVAVLNLPNGDPAVSVRQFGAGKVVRFSAVENWYFPYFTPFDANFLKVFVNAASWACR